ncbi:carboxymuconolactone decarboxylase family protein [Vineibacter terrae]|uniref:Carboxymuconolactone decarboxylase family protein n=1 Tax=Vineibacter terrae TaxID=2586908 RepID=A0A5C8PTD1_9HYPH|nr:carboxymuconolactone decarboxylase family protein [Vineibacter terrae]TXL79498.1 carboxymuconolactone decarboxylase family protein [Vineibacter terrae]HEX2890792.1 carboxymuconolactone decarboxylase family protein [Vineibacter terrae]
MKARLDAHKVAPETMKAVITLAGHVNKSGLEPSLIELVKLRASQINGCAYCVHLHSRDARAKGESEDRVQLLVTWQESPLYTDRERAALAWTEALTLLAQTRAPDDVYDEVRRHFSEEETVKLTALIGTINLLNRFGVGFRMVHPVQVKAAAAS